MFHHIAIDGTNFRPEEKLTKISFLRDVYHHTHRGFIIDLLSEIKSNAQSL